MIKYPVTVVKRHDFQYDEGGFEIEDNDSFFVDDSSGNEVANCGSSEEDANTIANALNAINRFPHPDGSTRGQVLNWFDKYVAPGIDRVWTNVFEGLDIKDHPEFNPPNRKE